MLVPSLGSKGRLKLRCGEFAALGWGRGGPGSLQRDFAALRRGPGGLQRDFAALQRGRWLQNLRKVTVFGGPAFQTGAKCRCGGVGRRRNVAKSRCNGGRGAKTGAKCRCGGVGGRRNVAKFRCSRGRWPPQRRKVPLQPGLCVVRPQSPVGARAVRGSGAKSGVTAGFETLARNLKASQAPGVAARRVQVAVWIGPTPFTYDAVALTDETP